MLFTVVVIVALGLVAGERKCTKDSHGVYRFHGKSCASTTRFVDGHRGSCGCGPTGTDTPFSWNLGDLTTAPSQKLFDDGGDSRWCGKNCGRCIKMTPTGGFIPGRGRAPSSLAPHIFLITNDCPAANENYQWCGQAGKPGTHHTNQYGYEAHFDLQNHRGQVSNGIHWDNPEVTWEFVDCPSQFKTKYHQCECH